ncbi:hypothetical protein KKG83_03535 [Candidatus Micrarchaeota archaeon]|nr:hypothetical protein [Candidatus Micrarchaeota archaeon]MBU2476517.1 hypothetical protein [Candidatus Micrarchaeota archaeon]
MADIQAWIQAILPELSAKGPELLIFSLSIVLYGVLIYHFYRFVATRDVFGFDLERFRRKEGSFLGWIINKFLGIIKYGAIFPFFVFIWFAGFSLLLFFMAGEELLVTDILKVSVAFVAAIRIASYYNDDLSKDMAKLIPFAFLGIALVDLSFFDQARILDRVDQIPFFITEIATYFSFIVVVEWAMRILLSAKFFVLGVNKKEIVKEHLKEQIEEIVED